MGEDNAAVKIGVNGQIEKPRNHDFKADALGATFYQTSTIEEGKEADLFTFSDIEAISK